MLFKMSASPSGIFLPLCAAALLIKALRTPLTACVPTLQRVLNNLYTGEQGVLVALGQFKACDYAWQPRNFIDATVAVCIGARRILEGAAIGDIQHSGVVIVGKAGGLTQPTTCTRVLSDSGKTRPAKRSLM